MLDRIFPARLDNGYRGSWLGLGIFVIAMAVKALQGVMSVIDTRHTAITADGIPVDSFRAAAQQEVLTMFALLGMWLVVLPALSAIALIRWRAMIPLLYLVLIAEQLAARLIVSLYTPASAQAGHPIGFYVNLGILAVTLIGFLLSLRERRSARANAASGA